MSQLGAIFKFSEGLGFLSMVGTAGGIAAIGYGLYTYSYYHYEITKKSKDSAQSSSASSGTS